MLPHIPKSLWREDERGCWRWIGSMDGKGYGRFKGEPAHRVTYREARGEIPPGHHIHHKCEVKCCVNPNHLEALPASQHIWHHQVAAKRTLSLAERAEIRDLARDHTIRTREIAEMYGVSESYIEFIINGGRFNEAGEDPVRPDPRSCVVCGKPIGPERRRHVRYCDALCRGREARRKRGGKWRPHQWKDAA